ncbi:hypothetical protein DH2020_018314 [Rehmannia glutinosa]|uniref:cysteine dioxygenase n=1 Tax=Rehmannia glutinosa TaxID=99300 RepID=A0ABR0WM49_REHGL
MTIEAAGLVEQFKRPDRVGHVSKVIKKKKLLRRKVRIQLKRPAINNVVSRTLQELFDSCKHVFKGPGNVPCASDVQKLCHILDGMNPEDVGLSKDLHFFKPKSEIEGTPRVTSATICKCDNFELCIFFLPANAVIPLHNHPQMTVFSKLLLGTMHIKAYDWIDSPKSDQLMSHSKLGLAKLKADTTFTAPCDTSVLYPTSGGNIHQFTAITPCAVLDVIGPPYSKDDGRDCSYYRETETPCDVLLDNEELTKVKGLGGCYRWLEEIEIPKESEMDGIEYMGPQIINSTS